MDAEAAVAYLLLFFGAAFVAFGLKNLFVDPGIGILSLASMAVLFGGVLSGVAVMMRRSPNPTDADA